MRGINSFYVNLVPTTNIYSPLWAICVVLCLFPLAHACGALLQMRLEVSLFFILFILLPLFLSLTVHFPQFQYIKDIDFFLSLSFNFLLRFRCSTTPPPICCKVARKAYFYRSESCSTRLLFPFLLQTKLQFRFSRLWFHHLRVYSIILLLRCRDGIQAIASLV